MLKNASAHICCVGLGWFPKTPGGLDRYVYELTHQLAADDDRVELYALDLPEAEADSVKLINLASADSPLWQRLWSIRTNFLSKHTKPDAINLHFALYSLPILQILPVGVPVTFTFHGPWALESKTEGASQLSALMKHWMVEKRVFRRVDRFIVLSKAFGQILHQEYQVDESKIHVIPGGVDLTRFQLNLSRHTARSQLNWPQDRMILFTPRRLVQRMGLDILLSVITKIKLRFPDVWLAIAGRGPMQASLEQQAKELELNDHVRFLGFLPDALLPVAYQAADLSIIPSQNLEGFGLTLVESLACGTPVLCTPVGGMPEILTSFSPNLIASSCSTAAIGELLEELLKGQVPIPSRTACHQYAATHFDWQKIAPQVRKVLLA